MQMILLNLTANLLDLPMPPRPSVGSYESTEGRRTNRRHRIRQYDCIRSHEHRESSNHPRHHCRLKTKTRFPKSHGDFAACVGGIFCERYGGGYGGKNLCRRTKEEREHETKPFEFRQP